MYCKKCGTQNQDHAKFCEKCGSSLISAEKSNYQHKTITNENSAKKKNRSYKPQVIGGCILIVVFVVVFGGLFIKKTFQNPNADESSIVSSSMVAQDGEWIYYLRSNNMDEKPTTSDTQYKGQDLWRSKLDGSTTQQITTDMPHMLEGFLISDDWIYFSKWFKGIWRIKTDGTNMEQLCEGTSSLVGLLNDSICYLARDSVKSEDDLYSLSETPNYTTEIRLMDLDGHNNQSIDIVNSEVLDCTICQGNIYYLLSPGIVGEEEQPSGTADLIEIDLPSGEKRTLTEIEYASVYDPPVLYSKSKELYFVKKAESETDSDKQQSICCYDLEKNRVFDTNVKVNDVVGFLLSDESVYHIKDSGYVDEYGYYYTRVEGLYKTDIATKKEKKLADAEIFDENVAKELDTDNSTIQQIGNWLFYNRRYGRENGTTGELWKIKTDGTQEQKIATTMYVTYN